MVDHIVAKADGVPLYVEELTKAILGSGVLEDRGDRYVLTARSRDCTSRRITGFADGAARSRAAAAGSGTNRLGSRREFAYDMISALAGIEEDMLQSVLGQLVVTSCSTSAAARRARATCSGMPGSRMRLTNRC